MQCLDAIHPKEGGKSVLVGPVSSSQRLFRVIHDQAERSSGTTARNIAPVTFELLCQFDVLKCIKTSLRLGVLENENESFLKLSPINKHSDL